MVERFMVYLTDECTIKNEVVPSGNYDAIAARLAEAVELFASARGKIDTLTIQGKGCQRDIDAFLAREEKP